MPVRFFSVLGGIMGSGGPEGVNPKVLSRMFEKTASMMEGQTRNLSNLIAQDIRDIWMGVARSRANREGWGEKYAQSIRMQPMTAASSKAVVYTDEALDMFVNLVEKGVRTWSIKDALLRGKAAKRNYLKYGTVFVRVPFRYRTPIKSGELREGTKQSSVFAGVLPQDIYNKVKNGIPLKGREYGKYAGLTRYDKGGHEQYYTFRTVSEKSKGWQYPEIAGSNVYELTVSRAKELVNRYLNDYVTHFTKDLKQELEGKG